METPYVRGMEHSLIKSFGKILVRRGPPVAEAESIPSETGVSMIQTPNQKAIIRRTTTAKRTTNLWRRPNMSVDSRASSQDWFPSPFFPIGTKTDQQNAEQKRRDLPPLSGTRGLYRRGAVGEPMKIQSTQFLMKNPRVLSILVLKA